jgi:hypothetical protein
MAEDQFEKRGFVVRRSESPLGNVERSGAGTTHEDEVVLRDLQTPKSTPIESLFQ